MPFIRFPIMRSEELQVFRSILLQACSEFKLFEGVMEWAQRRGSCPKGLDELAELLPFIRFPIMLSEELQVFKMLARRLLKFAPMSAGAMSPTRCSVLTRRTVQSSP